jgi:hypothetical protein
LVAGEGAAPSRHANLAFPGVYKTPLHGWRYPAICGVVYRLELRAQKATRSIGVLALPLPLVCEVNHLPRVVLHVRRALYDHVETVPRVGAHPGVRR